MTECLGAKLDWFSTEAGAHAFLRALIEDTTLEVLGGTHGLQPIQDVDRLPDDGLRIVSATAFSGPKLCGSLAFAVPSTEAGALLPLDWDFDMTLEACCSAVSETSNLLLGSLKRRLHANDVRIFLHTPSTSCGRTPNPSPPPGGMSIGRVFRSSMGRVAVLLNAVVDPAGGTSDKTEASGPDVQELLLF